ncbi:hypothetical protein TNCV_574991 [Trichonephila clavipes]|nr:hypothetical protein TNCV_574991 [Trichonephila clavipes]
MTTFPFSSDPFPVDPVPCHHCWERNCGQLSQGSGAGETSTPAAPLTWNFFQTSGSIALKFKQIALLFIRLEGSLLEQRIGGSIAPPIKFFPVSVRCSTIRH